MKLINYSYLGFLSGLILFLSGSSSFAQNGYFEPASIITLESDTIDGFINKLEEHRLNVQIEFKKKEAEDPIIYKAQDLKAFIFEEDNLVYEQVVYKRKDALKNTQTITRFGRILLRGHHDLYKIYLQEGEYEVIYIEQARYAYLIGVDGQTQLLEIVEKLYEGNKYKYNEKYKAKLTFIARDCPEVSKTIPALRFVDASLVKTVKSLNFCKDPSHTTVEIEYKSKKIISHTAHLGYAHLFSPLYQKSDGFGASYLVDLFAPDFNNNISFTTGLRYNYIALGNLNWKQSQHWFKVPAMTTIGTFRKNNKYIFLNLGLSFNYIYGRGKILLTGGTGQTSKFDLSLVAGMGVQFKKWKFFVLIDTDGIDAKETNNLLDIGIGYLFKNKLKS